MTLDAWNFACLSGSRPPFDGPLLVGLPGGGRIAEAALLQSEKHRRKKTTPGLSSLCLV